MEFYAAMHSSFGCDPWKYCSNYNMEVGQEKQIQISSFSSFKRKFQTGCKGVLLGAIRSIPQSCSRRSYPLSHLLIRHTASRCHDGFVFLPHLSSHYMHYQCWQRKRHYVKNKNFQQSKRTLCIKAQLDLAGGLEVINDLGLDTLTFLAATVLVVPTFKAMKASPILGFFLSGIILKHWGLIRNITDIKALSELGILFLLFEMGLELSLARLKALAKFAFGMGLAQVFFSTLAFTAFELPPNGAIGTRLLEFLFHSRPDLVNIRSVDEAVVIGAALSMSSSAFVLQLLAEKGELPTRFGSATLGILLFQDIAVVPLLVVLPILESGNLEKESVWPLLAAESLKALGGLGALSLGGRLLLRRIFEVVAESRSSEAFNALCLLTVTGTSLLTQKLGFSDTLGAFLAGAILAETNFRTQIEADIRPFRGLLLGLFFVTTGSSIDLELLIREWPNVLALLGGLIAIKTAIITAIGPFVGLSLPESVRIGLLLSQGGEFAFVVFSLANRLGVLPMELNRLLIIVVVLSMSLTPFLNGLGRKVADAIEARFEITQDDALQGVNKFAVSEPVVIIGFSQMGQVLASFLSTPLTSGVGGDAVGWPFIAFDLDPGRVKVARKLGFPVFYGDGSRPVVLQTAGVTMPKAVMIMYTGRQKAVQAVERLRLAFPGIPIYARAQDLGHLLELKSAGATDAILESAETSLQLGSVLLRGLGVMSDDVSFLTRIMRESMELRAREALEKKDGKGTDWVTPFQVKVGQSWSARVPKDIVKSEVIELSPNNFNRSMKQDRVDIEVGSTAEMEVEAQGVSRPSDLSSSNGSILGNIMEEEFHISSSFKVASPTGMGPESPLSKGSDFEPSVSDRIDGVLASKYDAKKHSERSMSSDSDNSRNSTSSSTLASSKLMSHRKTMYLENKDAELNSRIGGHHDEDQRGVTWCALSQEDGFHEQLEEGELPERIDETIERLSNMDRP